MVAADLVRFLAGLGLLAPYRSPVQYRAIRVR